MADSLIIYRVRQMDAIYHDYLKNADEKFYLTLYHYFINLWADDRDYIFSETDMSFDIFLPHKFLQLFETECMMSCM